MFNLLEGTCRQILGQVMDLNYHLTWIFSLCLAKYNHFVYYSPPTHLRVSIVAPKFKTFILVQSGGILGNYRILQDTRKDFWVLGNDLVMWGHKDILAPSHILHNNHR